MLQRRAAWRPASATKTVKAIAWTAIRPICPSETVPPCPSAETTASTIIPRMSSMTAAPRMIRASSERIWPRSASTRAVIPTLVATIAVPMKIASMVGSPSTSATKA